MSSPKIPNIGEDDYMHIYAQPCEHFEARIVGTVGALKMLRDALTEAIEKGRGLSGAFASDGEGYFVEIERAETPQALDAEPLPYLYLVGDGN